MGLLVLFRPRATGVTPPSESFPVPATYGPAKVKPPLILHRVRAGTARVLFRALAPRILLVSPASRAQIGLRTKAPRYELALSAPAKRKPLKYRAARDERDFDELVETAYLLSR